MGAFMLSPESNRDVLTQEPWLSIIGLGEDGVAGLGEAARNALSKASHVFGGQRHLALAAPFIEGASHPWPVPFDAGMSDVLALKGKAVAVLASGDPFFHGVGATLACKLAPHEFVSFPAPSAFSLAAGRLGWPLQDAQCLSVHGRQLHLLRPYLHPGAKIIALTSDAHGPETIAALLQSCGFGASRLTVLEALGGPDERIQSCVASACNLLPVHPLNVVAIEVAADEAARILPFGFGLADDLFEHDGQITKREIRALTLSTLSPRHGELLWDIGAGSGSIGIEWMLAHRSLAAIAIEKNSERIVRIKRNAEAFGMPGLRIVEGAAPASLAALPTPDAIFIGGGGSGDGVVEAAMAALRSGGRLVANAVTLEMDAVLLVAQARHGGTLTRIEVARAAPVGTMTGWRPAMPVTQWAWVKP